MKIKKIVRNILCASIAGAALAAGALSFTGQETQAAVKELTPEQRIATGVTPEQAIEIYGTTNYVVKLKVDGADKDKSFPFVFKHSGGAFHNEGCLLYGRYGDADFGEIDEEFGVNQGIHGAILWLKDGEEFHATGVPRNRWNETYMISDPTWKYFASEYDIDYNLEGYTFTYKECDSNWKPLEWRSVMGTPNCFYPHSTVKSSFELSLPGAPNPDYEYTQYMLITAIKKGDSSTVNVSGVTLDKASAQVKKNETLKLTATVNPSNATNKAVSWSSSNTGVATVDSNGNVKAVGTGTANITVKTSDGGKTAVCKITVPEEKVYVTGITLNKTSAQIKKNEVLTLTATVNPSNATDKSVTWSSSNTNVATVDSNGKVTAKGSGTANITVKTNDGNKTATCKITVPEEKIAVTGVTLDKTSAQVKKNESINLTATVSPSNATDKSITWSSSNTNVATVENGKVTAKGAGTANITVKTSDGGKTAVCKVTVPDGKVHVTGISLDRTSMELVAGDYEQLTAKVTPSDATDKSVTWSSSDTSVATVDANGAIKVNKVGETTITATTVDGGKKATCKIKVIPIKSGKVELDKTSVSLKAGETVKLTEKVLPTAADDKSVSWTSSDTNIATVDSRGNVKGAGAGTATITVKTNDTGKTATCKVTVTDDKIHVTGIKLDRTSMELLTGDYESLYATVMPSNATDKSVTWSSSNTDVATVNNKGEIKVNKVGETTITASTVDGNKKATCIIKVLPIKSTGVTLDKTSIKLKAGETVKLTEKVLPTATDDKSVTWTSSNRNVAVVDSKGNVKGIGEGTADIAVKTNDTGKAATCKVTVQKVAVSDVTLNKSSVEIKKGETVKITATINPINATDKNVSWVSDNTKVATVDSNGNVKAVGEGTANITIRTADGSKTALCAVNVKRTEATGIALDKNKIELNKNETAKLNAKITPDDTQNKTVTWISSNASVAAVDSNGNVKALSPGTATITAKTSNNKTASCMIVVPDDFTGVRYMDGRWVYCQNGKFDPTFTGVALSTNGNWVFVRDGVYNKEFTGVAKSTKGNWIFVTNGRYSPWFTGVAISTKGNWIFVRNGRYDTSFTGAAYSTKEEWVFVRNGRYEEFSGVATSINGNNIYINKGKFDRTFTGVAKAVNGEWLYMQEGKFGSWYTGIAKSTKGNWIFVKEGRYNTSFTGLVNSTDGVWRFAFYGRYMPEFTGVATTINGNKIFVKNGIIDKTFTGVAKSTEGEWLYVKDGYFGKWFTGVAKSTKGNLIYVKDGKYDTSFTGVAMAEDGKWLFVRNGRYEGFTGVAKSTKGNMIYVRNGVFDKTYTGQAVTTDGRAVDVRYGRMI